MIIGTENLSKYYDHIPAIRGLSIKIEEVNSYVEQYKDFQIEDKATADTAANLVKEIRKQSKELEDYRKRMTKPLDESKKEIMNLFKNPIDKLKVLRTYLDNKMLDYLNKIEEVNRAVDIIIHM